MLAITPPACIMVDAHRRNLSEPTVDASGKVAKWLRSRPAGL